MPRIFQDRAEVTLCDLKHDDGTPEIAVAMGGNFIARDLVAVEDYWTLRDERNNLYRHVNGLLGLLQLVRGRDDMPPAIFDALNTSHRATDAAAYLTQIVPPRKD